LKIYIAHSLGLSDYVAEYVKRLEKEGNKVYFPHRDTSQNATPTIILLENWRGIKWCDEVHVIWNGKSFGTIFDLGNAYAIGKPIFVECIVGVEEELKKLYKRSWYSYLYKNVGKYLDGTERKC